MYCWLLELQLVDLNNPSHMYTKESTTLVFWVSIKVMSVED